MLIRSSKIMKHQGFTKYVFSKQFAPKSFWSGVLKNTGASGLKSRLAGNTLYTWNVRGFASAQKVVFTSDPRKKFDEETKKTQRSTPNKLRSRSSKQDGAQVSKPTQPEYKNIDEVLQAYYKERREVFEQLRERWIHNITKRFDEDLKEDTIQEAFKSLPETQHLEWIKEADAYANGSSDPLAALLSKAIENSEKEGASSKYIYQNDFI
jgi:hypothetical protein